MLTFRVFSSGYGNVHHLIPAIDTAAGHAFRFVKDAQALIDHGKYVSLIHLGLDTRKLTPVKEVLPQ